MWWTDNFPNEKIFLTQKASEKIDKLVQYTSCIKSLSTYPNEVKSPGDHDNAGSSLLPDHSPEVPYGYLKGALSHNVCLWLHKTLKKVE